MIYLGKGNNKLNFQSAFRCTTDATCIGVAIASNTCHPVGRNTSQEEASVYVAGPQTAGKYSCHLVLRNSKYSCHLVLRNSKYICHLVLRNCKYSCHLVLRNSTQEEGRVYVAGRQYNGKERMSLKLCVLCRLHKKSALAHIIKNMYYVNIGILVSENTKFHYCIFNSQVATEPLLFKNMSAFWVITAC